MGFGDKNDVFFHVQCVARKGACPQPSSLLLRLYASQDKNMSPEDYTQSRSHFRHCQLHLLLPNLKPGRTNAHILATIRLALVLCSHYLLNSIKIVVSQMTPAMR